jgi:hypothetical protein
VAKTLPLTTIFITPEKTQTLFVKIAIDWRNEMPKYIITTQHRFEVETDNIREVLDNYEYPVFDHGVYGEAEYLDGVDTYEPVNMYQKGEV